MAKTRAPTARPRVAAAIGARVRAARQRAGLTQRQLAGERYTGAYISALETGLVRPSWAALTYLSEQLNVATDELVREAEPRWERLTADLHLAAGDWQLAIDRYTGLLDGTIDQHDAALLRLGRAEALCRVGRPREALPDATAAYEALTRLVQREEAAYAGYWLANAHYQLDSTAEARALLQQLLAEVRAGVSVQADFKLRLLVALSMVETWDGHPHRALALLEEGRALGDQMDDRRRASYLQSLADGYADTGDHEAALRAGREALTLFEAADADAAASSLRNSLALTYLQLGNLARASETVAEARSRFAALEDERMLAHVADTEAQIALARRDPGEVNARVAEALALAQRTGNTHAESSALLTLASSQRESGDLSGATSTYERAVELLRRVGPRLRLTEALRSWADLLVSEQRHAEAVALLREALAADR